MTPAWSLDLDPGEFEVAIRVGAHIESEDGEIRFEIDKLVLDTGAAFDLVAPDSIWETTGLRSTGRTRMGTLGGNVFCRTASVTLNLGRWRVRADLVTPPNTKDWLIGYPLLRWFDLLIRSVPSRQPCLIGPERTLLRGA